MLCIWGAVVPDIFDKVQCTGKATFNSLKVLLTFRWVTPQCQNVLNANLFELHQTYLDELESK